ncbi:MAG: hypothetical protein ABEH61_03860 [Haloarculaceae archaeon]
MYEDTPNKEELDWLAERIREVYDYDRLKHCDIDYLYNQEFGVMADMEIFKSSFPHEDSIWQGDMREFLKGEVDEGKKSLTDAEIMRLQMLKKEAEIEIRRAYGHRKELKREHRNKFANSIADALSSLVSIFSW